MSRVVQVPTYRTTDGEVFSTFSAAENHQLLLDLAERIVKSELFESSSSLTPYNLADWMVRNYEIEERP